MRKMHPHSPRDAAFSPARADPGRATPLVSGGTQDGTSPNSEPEGTGYSIEMIAAILNPRKCSDLVLCAMACLELSKGKPKSKKDEILAEMKNANSYFRPSMSRDITLSLRNLMRGKSVHEFDQGFYALTPDQKTRIKRILSGHNAIYILADWLHRDIEPLEKLLLILAVADTPLHIPKIKNMGVSAGFRDIKNWNLLRCLRDSNGMAISTKSGWVLTGVGKERIRQLGYQFGVEEVNSPNDSSPAINLRKNLDSITDDKVRNFVEEAIKCHEAGYYRAAIIMSWLGAIGVLYTHVLNNCPDEFNSEATKVFGNKWKIAKNMDDLSRMRESDFLDRIEGISLIGKSVKAQLKSSLDLRNGCAHMNSLEVGVNNSAAHLERLLLNVFEKFS